MQKTFDITIDDQQPVNPNNSFAIYRGDNVAFNFTFQRGGVALDVEGATLRVFAKKIQKNGQVDKLSNPLFAEDFIESNTATFNSDKTSGDAGNYILSVLLMSSENAVITSQCIYFELKENGYAGYYQPSEDFRDAIFDASQNVIDAEANAKQYSESAESSNQNAYASEQSAKKSEANAKSSENTARALSQSAEQYSRNAEQSANDCAESVAIVQSAEGECLEAVANAEYYARQSQEASERAIAITDPEGFRTSTSESIASLSEAVVGKSNRGELWFGGGISNFVKVSNMSMNGSWSLCCRIRMQTAQVRYASIFHFNAFYLYWNTRLCVLCSPVISTAKQISVDDNNRLANGEWHTLVVSYDGTTLKLTDETGVLLSVATSEQISISGNLLIGEANYNGQIADIKYFNFDITSANAPYTLADYISGKNESPICKGAMSIKASELTFASASTGSYPSTIECNADDDTITITATADTNNNLLWIRKNYAPALSIPKGAIIEYSFDDITSSTGQAQGLRLYLGASASSSEFFYYGPIVQAGTYELVMKESAIGRLDILPYDASKIKAGTTFTIKGLKIKVNGVLLSLADYTFNGEVLDESGNGNNATITGNVNGTNDSAVESLFQKFASRIQNLTA